jgi:putative transposase
VVETVLLQRLYLLVLIGHGIRRLHVAGVTAHPIGAWAVRQARNLAMDLGDRLGTLRFLIHDRDPAFTAMFGEVFKAEELRISGASRLLSVAVVKRAREAGQVVGHLPGHTSLAK